MNNQILNTPKRLERFWSKVLFTSDCWEWIAGKNTDGYGTFGRIDGKTLRAYRVSYELYNGKIPEGLELDHLCRNRVCVNPNHLEPVTHRENVMRGNGIMVINSKKTHCPQGHELFGENLVKSEKGRKCRICLNERNRIYRLNHRRKIE